MARELQELGRGSMLGQAIVDCGKERDELRKLHRLPAPKGCGK
jgi:hypothetical protein